MNISEIKSKWIVDGSIKLGEICEASEWHRGTVESALREAGLSTADAGAFAAFAFADKFGGDAEDEVDDSRWSRLDVR